MADTVVVKRTENRLVVTKQDPKAIIAAPYVKNINQYAYSLTVLGYYENLSALVAGVPTPDVGDVYGVGTSAPYTIYIWDGTSWVDNGTIKGDKGDPTEWLRGTVDPNTEGVDGDLYLNYTTWHIWEKATGTWTDRGSIKGVDGSGSGDVTGPSSSVDSNFAAFDGVDGTTLKDSGKSASSFLESVAGDATPELGGNLDLLTYKLTKTGAGVYELGTDEKQFDFNLNTAFFTLVDNTTGTTIDWRKGNKQTVAPTTGPTYTFTAPGGACNLLLKLTQHSTAVTITWPATVKWCGATPDFSTNSAVYIICFFFDGTNYYGTAVKKVSA